MDHFASLWSEASRDIEAEGAERIRTQATQAAAAAAWPFLSVSQSENEFNHRLAMVEDRLSAIAAEHGLTLDDVVSPLRAGFEATLAPKALTAEASKERGPSYDPEGGWWDKIEAGAYGREHQYKEGYDHGLGGEERKGYGSRDKSIAYGAGYDHGQQDAEDGWKSSLQRETSLQAEAAASCGNCGHANPMHAKGALCECGCEAFQPKSKPKMASGDYDGDPTSQQMQENGDYAGWKEHNYGDGFKTHNINGHNVHEFASTAQGYNHTQTSDKIKSGDVLSVPSEGVHGFLHEAWPVASTKNKGEFHGANMEGLLGEFPHYRAAHELALSLGNIHPRKGPDETPGDGFRDSTYASLHTAAEEQPEAAEDEDEDKEGWDDKKWGNEFFARLASMRQALMEGQDPLGWVMDNGSSSPANAERPGGHWTTQEFAGGAPVAIDQAMSSGGGSVTPEAPAHDQTVEAPVMAGSGPASENPFRTKSAKESPDFS